MFTMVLDWQDEGESGGEVLELVDDCEPEGVGGIESLDKKAEEGKCNQSATWEVKLKI